MYIHVLKKDGKESKYLERDSSVGQDTEIICYNKNTKNFLARERQFVRTLKLKTSEVKKSEDPDSGSKRTESDIHNNSSRTCCIVL